MPSDLRLQKKFVLLQLSFDGTHRLLFRPNNRFAVDDGSPQLLNMRIRALSLLQQLILNIHLEMIGMVFLLELAMCISQTFSVCFQLGDLSVLLSDLVLKSFDVRNEGSQCRHSLRLVFGTCRRAGGEHCAHTEMCIACTRLDELV